MRHLAELARVDQARGSSGSRRCRGSCSPRPATGPVARGVPDQVVELLEGGGRRLLQDDVGPGVERVHRQGIVRGRRGGDVDHVGPDLRRASPGGRCTSRRRRSARRPTRPSPATGRRRPRARPRAARGGRPGAAGRCARRRSGRLSSGRRPFGLLGTGTGSLDDPGRDARPRRPRRDVAEDHAHRPDLGPPADPDPAEDLGIGPELDVVLEDRGRAVVARGCRSSRPGGACSRAPITESAWTKMLPKCQIFRPGPTWTDLGMLIPVRVSVTRNASQYHRSRTVRRRPGRRRSTRRPNR